jgi:hypothetical protein
MDMMQSPVGILIAKRIRLSHCQEDKVVNGVRYINTGAWTEFPAFYLHVTAEGMALKTMDDSFRQV